MLIIPVILGVALVAVIAVLYFTTKSKKRADEKPANPVRADRS